MCFPYTTIVLAPSIMRYAISSLVPPLLSHFEIGLDITTHLYMHVGVSIASFSLAHILSQEITTSRAHFTTS